MKLTQSQQLIREVRLSLGEPKLRVELAPEHYDLALNYAFSRYRYRSGNSIAEKIMFLDLIPNQSTYTLPNNIRMVKSVQRRGAAGTISGGGTAMDPFGLAYTNQFLLTNGTAGGLLTYELQAGYHEQVMKMFGGYITHRYDPVSHQLIIDRHIRMAEQVLLLVFEEKSDDILLTDYRSRQWIRDYTVAKCKEFLGEIRGKFSSLPAPGGSSFNGDALKAEAQATMERLENEIKNFADSDFGMPFVIG